jgi:hypothetical protein
MTNIDAMVAAMQTRRLNNSDGQPSGIVVTAPAILQWPALDKPTKLKDSPGEPKFSVTLILPNAADLGPLRSLAGEAAQAKFGAGYKNMNLKSPFRPQADKGKFDGFGIGSTFIVATSYRAVNCYGPGGSADLLDPGSLYAGCIVRARVNAYAYDKGGNRGIAFGLSLVQKLADGPKLRTGGDDVEDGLDAVPAAVAAAGGVRPATVADVAAGSGW